MQFHASSHIHRLAILCVPLAAPRDCKNSELGLMCGNKVYLTCKDLSKGGGGSESPSGRLINILTLQGFIRAGPKGSLHCFVPCSSNR